MEQGPVRTISEIAVAVDAQRPSVSRSLKTLRSDNLVERKRSGWKLTQAGEDEAKRCNQELSLVADSLRRDYMAVIGVTMMKASNTIPESIVSGVKVKHMSSLAPAPPSGVLQAFPKTVPHLFSPMPVYKLAQSVSSFAGLLKVADGVGQFVQLHQQSVSWLAELSKVFAQSIAPLADAQLTLSKVIAQSLALPNLGFVMSQNSTMLSRAIEDIQAVHSAPQIRVHGFDKVFYPGVLSDIRDISASYRMLLGESSTMAAAGRDLTEMQQIWSGMLIPSSTVASYTHSLRSGVALTPEPNRESLPPLYDREEPQGKLYLLLAELNPDLVDRWKGSWQALGDTNPDGLCQAAFSYRELIRLVLDELAPEVEIDPSEQGSKRKNQVRQVRGGLEGDFLCAMVKGLYDLLSKYAHTTNRTEAEVQGALMTGDGFLLILLSGR